MRARYDSKGKLVGFHNMIYDNIPDDYQMQKVILENKVYDLSYVGVMKYLRSMKVSVEFEDDRFYATETIAHMALDYLNSARFLYRGIVGDRDGNTVSNYLVPCAFLCKHSIELKLKEALLVKGKNELKGHSVLKIWEELDEMDMIHSDDIYNFLLEVEKIDNNEMALRYGISKKLLPLQEDFKFNIDNLITNTMFMFNVIDEHVICKYRHKKY